ncbi:MAG: glycosyltransferase family 2 protein [Verrucomicrobiota bacterium]|nr:glycosyltransferase family 2 protein [Verrucomicrobiota bacterium]
MSGIPTTVDISVVVPIYNEEENVPILVEELRQVLSQLKRSYEILLVDDGSADQSWDFLVAAARKCSCVRLIRFRRNFGQTAAMTAGFRESRGKVIVTMDADLQNDPAEIPKLLDRMDAGFDVVSGWRKNRQDPYLTRRLPSAIANRLISWFTGVALHDYGCTLKAYSREVVTHLDLYGEMHRFIPALASWVGGLIAEVPVNHRPRRFGKSKYGLSRIVKVILDLLTVKFLLRYSTRPIQIFGKLGLLFGLLGALMMLVVLGGHLAFMICGQEGFADDLIKRPFWVIAPFMLILFCLQFISMGLLAEIQIRTYHESQNKPIYVIRERVESSASAGP